MVVEQISNNDNSNVTGPMVANNSAKSNVTGPKVAPSKSNSNVMGPMETRSNASNKINGPNVTDPPNSQNSQTSSIGALVDSDSSSSESWFKTPHSPKPRRAVSQNPSRSRSRSPLVPDSPGAHRGMPQVPRG